MAHTALFTKEMSMRRFTLLLAAYLLNVRVLQLRTRYARIDMLPMWALLPAQNFGCMLVRSHNLKWPRSLDRSAMVYALSSL